MRSKLGYLSGNVGKGGEGMYGQALDAPSVMCTVIMTVTQEQEHTETIEVALARAWRSR